MNDHIQRAYDLLERITSADLNRSPTQVRNAITESLGALRLAISQEMPKGWSAARFNILLANTLTFKEVDGIRLEEALLGVHVDDMERAHVTHIPSGKRLHGFKTLGQAVRFAESIKVLYPWREVLLNISPATERLILAAARVVQEEARGAQSR